MSRFVDIERFVSDHRACGTLTPVTSSPGRGGYTLTLSCSCGQNFERWITAEEAETGPAPSLVDVVPTPSASREPAAIDISAASSRAESLHDVMQAALDAIDAPPKASAPAKPSTPAATSPPPRPPTPSTPTSSSPPARPATPPIAAPASTPVRPATSTTPPAAAQSAPHAATPQHAVRRQASSDKPDRTSLEDALRATLAALGDEPPKAEASPTGRVMTLDPSFAAGGAPAVPGQKPDKQTLHSALQATLDALEAEKKTSGFSGRGAPSLGSQPAPGRRRRLSVPGAVGIALALAAAVGVGYALNALGQRPAAVGAAPPPRIVVRLKPSESERVSIAQAVQALRELQSVSRVDVPYRQYVNRVSFVKGDVDRHLGQIRDTELRAALSDTMALHLLAAAAWRAKTLNEKEKWEAVGEDPSAETCAAAKRLLAITDDAPSLSRAQWRGMTLAAGVPLLWDCAADRLGEVERGLDPRDR